MVTIDDIKSKFPNLLIQSLNDGAGCNIHLNNGSCIVVWFKKQKFNHNKKSKVWHQYPGKNSLLKSIEEISNMYSTKSKPIKVEAIKTDGGVQACIDHLKKKLETFERVHTPKEDNQTVTMLKTLIDELYQYL